jgi:hypothetical protein
MGQNSRPSEAFLLDKVSQQSVRFFRSIKPFGDFSERFYVYLSMMLTA